MSTAIRSMTAEEFFDFVHLPENADRSFELDEGEVVEVTKPGRPHGITCLAIGIILWNYCQRRRAGYACSNDTGLIVSRNPDTVRGPDLSLYADTEERTFREVVDNAGSDEPLPLLAVEILSPTDRPGAVMRKVRQYQRAGVRLVWVVDPIAEDVIVHRLDEEPFVLGSEDTMDGGDLLPEFSCPVANFFCLPAEG